jgi:hypothetical protein
MKTFTTEQKVISTSHSLRLRNIMIDELNKAKRENAVEELISYYQREIDQINEHLSSVNFRD